MRNLLLIIVFAAIGSTSYAQNGKIFFLKNNGKYVQDKDSADFMRVVEEPDSGSVHYKITEYYPNSVRKLIGTASVYWPKMIWEGPSISFDKQGKKTRQITYKNNSPAGTAYYFYPTGRVMKELDYSNVDINTVGKAKVSLKYRLMSYYDSTGVQLIKDGNGYLKESPNKKINEEGNYVNGVRHGIWKGIVIEDGSAYQDTYDNGKFLSGKSFKPDGKVVEYTVKDVVPKFPGGETGLSKFLSSNIKYPVEARDRGISGKVVLSYMVEKDGYITDIEVVSSPHYALEEEAVRVLKRSPKWEPGIQNGIPVRVKYTLPITFSLNGVPLQTKSINPNIHQH